MTLAITFSLKTMESLHNGLQPIFKWPHCYRLQIKFGAKVMFLHLSLILFEGRGLPSSMHHRSQEQGSLPLGGSALGGGSPFRGVCLHGVGIQGGLPPGWLGRLPLPQSTTWCGQQTDVRILLECILVFNKNSIRRQTHIYTDEQSARTILSQL